MAAAEMRGVARGAFEEDFRGPARLAGQHQQELAAAARSEQNAGEAEFLAAARGAVLR